MYCLCNWVWNVDPLPYRHLFRLAPAFRPHCCFLWICHFVFDVLRLLLCSPPKTVPWAECLHTAPTFLENRHTLFIKVEGKKLKHLGWFSCRCISPHNHSQFIRGLSKTIWSDSFYFPPILIYLHTLWHKGSQEYMYVSVCSSRYSLVSSSQFQHIRSVWTRADLSDNTA